MQHTLIGRGHGPGRAVMVLDERGEGEQEVAQDSDVESKAKAALQVLVVGSGVSGLSAARTLIDNWPATAGPLSVTVLEAGNRLGGRTFTNRNISGWGAIRGGEADYGASWLHQSSADHPITRIKDALKLEGFVTEDDKIKVFKCAKGQTSACDEMDDDRFSEYEAALEAAKESAQESSSDISVLDALKQSSSKLLDDPVIQYHLTNDLEFNTGAPPSTLSGKYYDNDSQFEGDETILVRGYGQVPDALAAGSIKLAAACNDPDAKAPTVTAVADQKARKALKVRTGVAVTSVERQEDGPFKVGTRSGESLTADHVVLTVPLGVLKAGAIRFSPALSAPKRTAIARLGFGNVLKIGLQFDTMFWDASTHYFGLVQDPGLSRAEKFGYVLNAAAVAQKPVLFTFAFGASATEVEGWSDAVLRRAVTANLVKIFGEKAQKARLVSMWRSSWGTDPLFRGAYSYAAVGSSPGDWAELAKSAADGHLHFAGEHTSAEYRGTVHGALLSGQRAACEVLEEL